MKLVAITGSIGCGKTTISHNINKLGYTVFDVDGWVRRLYFKPHFLEVVAQHFPEVIRGKVVNKRALRNIVFADNKKLKLLESLIHPFLLQTLKDTIRKNAMCDDLFFLDVALLFEMGWDKYCDFVIVADVDYKIQKQRVMLRDKISADDFDMINNVQMSNLEKKQRADVIIDTNTTPNLLRTELIYIIKGLQANE